MCSGLFTGRDLSFPRHFLLTRVEMTPTFTMKGFAFVFICSLEYALVLNRQFFVVVDEVPPCRCVVLASIFLSLWPRIRISVSSTWPRSCHRAETSTTLVFHWNNQNRFYILRGSVRNSKAAPPHRRPPSLSALRGAQGHSTVRPPNHKALVLSRLAYVSRCSSTATSWCDVVFRLK